jgi:four helix bundle protein
VGKSCALFDTGTGVPACFRRAWSLHSKSVMLRSDLEERSARFAADVFGLTNAVRANPGGRRPADQLLDCATSVASNYRASARARSRDEFIAKLGVVNEEADEVVYWLEFLWRAGLGEPSRVDRLLAEAKELRAIFSASCGTAKRNHRGRRRSGR